MPYVSSKNALNHAAVFHLQPLAAGNFQSPRIEPQLVQHRGVDVGHVVAVFDGEEAELIGRPVHDAALDSAAGHPHGEAKRMMVAAVRALGPGRAAELGGPHDERFVQQAALLQVLESGRQSAYRPAQIGGVVRLQVAVRVPAAGAADAAVIDLHESHAAFHQPPRGQAILRERGRGFAVQAIQLCVAAVSCWNSNTSGIARCMRNASSYDLIRARALASSGYSASVSRFNRSSSSNSACCSSRKTPWAGRPNASGLFGSATKRHAVVLGAEVIGPMRLVTAAAIGQRSAQHDELRQVLVQRAQAVVNPRADRRKIAVEHVAAGVKLQLGAVIDVVGPHRANDREVVDARADVRPPIADFDAAFAALLEADLQRV